MTFDELLVDVNRRLHRFLGEEKSEPISERTLRYWISKGILSKRVTRGPKTTYPESFVWRVILTRQYQLFSAKTLDEIAEVQQDTADEDVIKQVRAFWKREGHRQAAPSRGLGKKIPADLRGGLKNTGASSRAIEHISERIEKVWSQLDQSLQVQDEIIRQIHGAGRQNYEVVSHHYDRQSEQFERLSMMVNDAFDQMRNELEKNSMHLASSVDDIRAEVGSLARTIENTARELEEIKVALKKHKEDD